MVALFHDNSQTSFSNTQQRSIQAQGWLHLQIKQSWVHNDSHVQHRADPHFKPKDTHFAPDPYCCFSLMSISNPDSRVAIDFYTQKISPSEYRENGELALTGIKHVTSKAKCTKGFQIPHIENASWKSDCINSKLPTRLHHTHKLQFLSPAMHLLL